MDWYYSENGQQNGPVSEAQFEELVHSGRITDSTLVWTAGMAGWQAYGALGGSGGENEHCVSCGKLFACSELIRYETSWVCASCKPAFFQRVKEGLAGSDRMVWREKRAVVMGKNGLLPDRCAKCNNPANGWRLVRNLRWHSPVVYFCLLLNLLIYVIVALIVSQRARVEVGLCDKHRSQRLLAISISWGMFLLAVVMFVCAARYEHGAFVIVGIVLLLAAFIYGMWKGRSIYAKRIDKERVWMKGFCKAYLDELPEWTSGK